VNALSGNTNALRLYTRVDHQNCSLPSSGFGDLQEYCQCQYVTSKSCNKLVVTKTERDILYIKKKY
jgi:hypothetical protein